MCLEELCQTIICVAKTSKARCMHTTSWTQCPVPRIQHSHACSYYNYYCDYHKIILHTVESRSVNVPLIVAATVPSFVVVILVSVIIVTFTIIIIVYKQVQKKRNEGNNLYDAINLSDVPPVPPGLPSPNVKFETNQNIAYEAQQFKSDEKNWDMNKNESYQKPPQHDDYEQVEVNLETHTSDPNYLEVIG